MVDDRHVTTAELERSAPRSPWRFLLPLVWAGLAARLVVAVMRNEPFSRDFLSIALVAFFMTTAVLGSRIWLWFHDRSELRHQPAART